MITLAKIRYVILEDRALLYLSLYLSFLYQIFTSLKRKKLHS